MPKHLRVTCSSTSPLSQYFFSPMFKWNFPYFTLCLLSCNWTPLRRVWLLLVCTLHQALPHITQLRPSVRMSIPISQHLLLIQHPPHLCAFLYVKCLTQECQLLSALMGCKITKGEGSSSGQGLPRRGSGSHGCHELAGVPVAEHPAGPCVSGQRH